MNHLLQVWAKLPESVQNAIITGCVVNALAFLTAFKMWLNARFFKGAFHNVVEAVHLEKCDDCAAAAKARNEADGIESKVQPIVEKVKAALDAAVLKEGKPDAKKE